MNISIDNRGRLPLNRRQMLCSTGLGFGTVALGGLLSSEGLLGAAESSSAVTAQPGRHFAPQAKSVIMLMQPGGVSQVDLFDPKPELTKHAGQVHRDKVEMFQPGSEGNKLLATPFQFIPRGQSGMEISEVIPHIGSIADQLCMIRSMHTGHNNHTESLVMITSGKIFPGRPTLGAWISYALGTENQNLPSYVVLRDPDGYPGTGATLWQNGWLPAMHRGTEFSSTGQAAPNLRPKFSISDAARRDDLQFLQQMNQIHRREYPEDSILEARIRNYELAARMQLAAGDALDLSRETQATSKLYGLDQPATASVGRRYLMARRLIESGVRFVQVFPGAGNPWDTHGDTKTGIEGIASKVDLPTAGLIRDLESRGLLDQTIVIWTGEFGRLPVSQNGTGRDHNRNAFTLLMAGGGFKAGYVHGATDDVGYRSVEKRVGVNDLFATVLHQLGIDHDNLVYRHHGRDETLTDSPVTGASVVREILTKPAST